VPVRLLPTPAVLEVVLERGCVVRVPVGFDAATLGRIKLRVKHLGEERNPETRPGLSNRDEDR
jgi:hypothetical protein